MWDAPLRVFGVERTSSIVWGIVVGNERQQMSTALTVTSPTAKRRGGVQRDPSAHMAPRVCVRDGSL